MAEQQNGNGFVSKYAVIIQTVTVVAIFIGGFWAGVITPIKTQLDNMLTIREHEEFKRGLDYRLNKNDQQILRLQTEQETKEAAAKIQAQNDNRLQRTQDDLKEIREMLVGSSTLKDVIADLRKQLDDLRAKVLAPAK